MRVQELIDILSDHPPDLEVELAVIAPVEESAEDITIDRFEIEGVLAWRDPDDDDGSGSPGEWIIWLVAGEEADVDAFQDALEQPDDEEED